MTLLNQITKALRVLRQPGGLRTLLFVLIPRYLASQARPRLNVEAGQKKQRNLKLSPSGSLPQHPPVDIIICVHNALSDVRHCLDSVLEHSSQPYRIILINDGSDQETSSYLREIAARNKHVELSESKVSSGYTIAANKGLSLSSAEHIVLLNSDTIVAGPWLEKLSSCLESNPETGICGPLSNAASWQSVPQLFDGQGDWAVNELPEGVDLSHANQILEKLAPVPRYPEVHVLNGFCLALKKKVLDVIGHFDAVAFPMGYGEENDFCLRASRAGFRMAICENLYVFHAKSKSYSHEKRKLLSRAGNTALLNKHKDVDISKIADEMQSNPSLARIRSSYRSLQNLILQPEVNKPKILFILPASGGGGGVNSIVQEVEGLRMLGVDAKIAVQNTNRFDLFYFYKKIFAAGDFFTFYSKEQELLELAADFNIAVATIFTSVSLLEKIVRQNPFVMPAYYVQDYEPFFFEFREPSYLEALESYTRIEDNLLFAKTDWIAKTINARQGIDVAQVRPSLDQDIFSASPKRKKRKKVVISAMIRPETPRRGAERSMQVLRRLQKELPRQVEVLLFGCSKKQLKMHELLVDFAFKARGKISRREVAQILQKSHIFLDLSDYQAFGRTGLEAMACGCIPVLPRMGGVYEYAIDGENSLIVNTSDEELIHEKIKGLLADSDARKVLAENALQTAARYSIVGSALSEFEVLSGKWLEFLEGLDILEESTFPTAQLFRPSLLLVSDNKDSTLQQTLPEFFAVTKISSTEAPSAEFLPSVVLIESLPTLKNLKSRLARLKKNRIPFVALHAEYKGSISVKLPADLEPRALCHRVLEVCFRSGKNQHATRHSKCQRRELYYYSFLSLLKRCAAALPR